MSWSQAAPLDWHAIGNAISAGVPAGSGTGNAPASATGEGYSSPDLSTLPGSAPPPSEYPSDGGGYSDPSLDMSLSLPMAGPYDNIDHARISDWERGVRERGNEVRVTGVGTFEVDSGGRIVAPMPSFYRMD